MVKLLFRYRKYLRVAAILIAAAGICSACLRIFREADVPGRPVPPDLDRTVITAKYLEDEGLLAVTQTMEITNRSGAGWPDLMLRLPANAFPPEELSPASAGGWPMALDWAEADGVRTEPAEYSADRTSCLLPVSVPAGQTVRLLLRWRLDLPVRPDHFGRDGKAVRLLRVFPSLGIWDGDQWDASAGDGWNAPVTRFSFEIGLPAGCTLAAGCAVTQKGSVYSGELPAADDLCLVILTQPFQRFSMIAGGTVLTAFAENGKAREAASLLAPYVKRLAGLYGPSPMQYVTVCVLPDERPYAVFPGLIVLGEEQLDRFTASPADAAWCAAWQWFGAGFSTDGFREHWLSSALSEWAGQQALLTEKGPAALEERRRTFVDEAMRENLHLSLTPGSPLSYFPDESTLCALTRGRGCAFLIAADTMCGGRMNEFLRELAGKGFYRRLTEALFLRELNAYFSMDFSPLLLDYIHTYY